MKPITALEEMKNIQLSIMKEVHIFCTDNGIQYFLSHGSLIGAVRHNGFIPWDDDIDIFMLRSDYERFITLFKERGNIGNLKLVNSETKPYYGRPMSKVIDDRTILMEPDYIGDDPIGVNIDIWPLDGVPNDENTRKKHMKKINFFVRLLYGRILASRSCKGVLKKLVHFVLLPIPSKCFVNLINNNLKKYQPEDCDMVSCYVDPYKKSFKTIDFNCAKLVPFEGEEFFIPCGFDNILTELYGDYKQLPPIDQQKPHHIINTYWVN